MSVSFKDRQFRNTAFLLLLVFLTLSMSGSSYVRSYLDFAESLDKTAVIVDGRELTLSDLAFYIAYEEGGVEETAFIYNPEDTGEYWRIHTNGVFIRTEAKQTAMDMAVHDEIFYQLACDEGLVLTDEEEAWLANDQYDFWSDLEEEQREALGVEKEVIDETMRKMALAQKAQSLYAQMNDTEEAEYDFNGEAYQELLENHEVEIVEKVWDRVHFGSITVDH